MPNHETNTVVTLGEPGRIRRFVAEALVDLEEGVPEKVIDFTLIVPPPEGIETTACTGEHALGVTCWYRWNPENWGTKWNAYNHSHYSLHWLKSYDGDVYGRVDLRFQTAWSQPTLIFEAIERRWGVTVHAVTQDEGGYPDVTFGDPFESEVMHKVETFKFDHWDNDVDEPTAEVAS